MSPLGNVRCLSSWSSREGHCNWDVIPSSRDCWFTFLRFGHLTSTSLLPLAPPRFAARLHRYNESSDFCRAASSDGTGIVRFVPYRRTILPRRTRAIGQAVSPAAACDGSSSASCTRQISLLISFDLPTIPSPTTALPFRHGRFLTLLHRRDLPCLSPRRTSKVGGICRRTVKGSDIARSLPDRLGRIEFTFVTDWSFVSGCSPPFFMKRSYHYRLQAGNVSLGGTCTLLVKRLHRRTSLTLRVEPCT